MRNKIKYRLKDKEQNIIVNNKYQIYFDNWVVYHLIGNPDFIAQYIWKIVDKLKSEIKQSNKLKT